MVLSAVLAEANCHAHFCSPSTNSFEWPDWAGGGGWVTKVTFLCVLGTALVTFLFWYAFRKPQLVPRGAQNVVESVYDFVGQQIVEPVIGEEGRRFTPYLVTLFSFIFVMNVWEIIPVAQFPVTSRFAFPCFLALITWLIFNYIGIKRQGFGGYFKNIMIPPDVPLPLLLILAPVELLSTIIVRPFTLMVRLFANMFAGHVLLLVFFLGCSYLFKPSITALWSVASFGLGTVMIGFELFIDALQAYIFTILTAVYIAGALAPEH